MFIKGVCKSLIQSFSLENILCNLSLELFLCIYTCHYGYFYQYSTKTFKLCNAMYTPFTWPNATRCLADRLAFTVYENIAISCINSCKNQMLDPGSFENGNGIQPVTESPHTS
uniref:Uncharacterized protein n=1 Tax=Arundo donax TaxID=35708 RepID=A0A0A9HIC5_ARUDO